MAVGLDLALYRPRADPPDIATALPEPLRPAQARPPVEFVRHHLAHAASTFFCSRFRESAVLGVDGQRESESTTLVVRR